MRDMLRRVGSVVAGLVAGFLVIACVEAVGTTVYPPQTGLDFTDSESIKAYVDRLPLGAFLFVLAAWGAGCLVGCWLATRLGADRRTSPGVIVGVILLAAGVANMMMLPHPGWFWVAEFLVCTSFTYVGTRLGTGRTGG